MKASELIAAGARLGQHGKYIEGQEIDEFVSEVQSKYAGCVIVAEGEEVPSDLCEQALADTKYTWLVDVRNHSATLTHHAICWSTPAIEAAASEVGQMRGVVSLDEFHVRRSTGGDE